MDTYLNLIDNFWKINDSNKFSSSTAFIYFHLLSTWKEKEFSNSFECSDNDIEKKLNISRKTIRNSKDFLRNKGLIKFKINKGLTTQYQIELDIIDAKPIIKTNLQKLLSDNEEKQPINAEIEKQPVKKVPQKKAKKQTQPFKVNIPTIEEFLAFAKTIEIYKPDFDFQIKTKYEQWKDNGWKNGHNRHILNWKTSLKSTMPYFAEKNKPKDLSIPTINKPKATYNE